MKKIEKFAHSSGQIPFDDWLDALDLITQDKVSAYIDRVAMGGGMKNIKPVGRGVFEIKIDYGPGYRVYFGQAGKVMILLLLGGDKKTQNRDIRKAQEYWEEYEQN